MEEKTVSEKLEAETHLVPVRIAALITMEADERQRRADACCGDCSYCDQHAGGAKALRRLLKVLNSEVPALSAMKEGEE